MSGPITVEVENTGEVFAVAVGEAIVVEGVQIPPGVGARKLDDLTDVAGATLGLTGQVLAKSGDGQWRPATLSGGGGLLNYVAVQVTPAATWSITHPLGRYPQVTVLDADGQRLLPDVEYDSISAVTITHAEPLAGTVILT